MRSIKWFLALALAFGLALGSLASAQERTGAWVDSVVISREADPNAAVLQLSIGVLDVYAFTLSDPAIKRTVEDDPGLTFTESYGSYNELSFNPCGPVFPTGRLNPFAVPRVREAMNWLVDRNYVSQEIYGGLAVPRYTALNTSFPDYARYVDVVRAIELTYAYDLAKADAVISEEMEKLGATKVGGIWHYQGSPAVISLLIRSEDERVEIGNYVANQLEDIGFATERLIRTAAEASPIWISGDPCAGVFHIYTGGWISTVIGRDIAGNFAFFYTDTGLASPLWQAYVNDPEFYEVAIALDNSDFTNLDERRELFERALVLSMEDSNRIWLNDRVSFAPQRAEITVATDLAGAVSGSWLWAHTLRRGDDIGGRVDIGLPSVLTNPWNPIGGSNWIFDAMLYRATGEQGHVADPYTGLWYPNRVERAEVVVQEGLPVGVTLDWVDLSFAPTINVPADAWADWDAVEQRWITVGEKYPEGTTALRKSTVYYPANLFDTVKWHDGSPVSAADFVLGMILGFDRAKPESAIHDPAAVPAFNSFIANHRGYRITSTDPLVIEVYSNSWVQDAELNVSTMWPQYNFGPGSWHALAIGILSESEQRTAFTSARAGTLDVDQLNMISGPSIGIMDEFLAQAQASSFVPYDNVLGAYLQSGEAASRYTNLAGWREARGHYWVGTGPLFLDRAFPLESTVVLQRNPLFSDPADRWARFGTPTIAEVEVDGPARVTIGSSVTYDVFVSFADEAYASADLDSVKYLLFDATGALAALGDADYVAEGVYGVTLGADVTSALAVGSNRLEIAVSSLLVSLPSFDSLEFVTTR